MELKTTLPQVSERLLTTYGVAGPRYTSYPTAPEWKREFGAEDFRAALARASERKQAPLSLYVHVPFCRSLCWYCGCNVVISKTSSDADRYLDALETELELVTSGLGSRRLLSQVHFGGGTPTFLSGAQLARLWSAITRHFLVAPGAELAIEVHPARTTPSQLTLLSALGFNRLSMGLQDFDPRVQEATHRIQTPEETRALLDHARSLGFTGVNFDLIYGLPYQTEASWERTLEQVTRMQPDRLAIYSFAFIPEVLKHQRRMPREALPSSALKLKLFRSAYDRLVALGYRPIGMDHFALPTDELARAQGERTLGRNFQGYTVQTASEVVAVGASAISDLGGVYAQNVRGLAPYYERLSKGQLATDRGLRLSQDDYERRRIISSLMCNFWADLGPGASERFPAEQAALARLESDGLLERDGTELLLTPLGRLFVRNVAMVFDAYLPGNTRKFSQTV